MNNLTDPKHVADAAAKACVGPTRYLIENVTMDTAGLLEMRRLALNAIDDGYPAVAKAAIWQITEMAARERAKAVTWKASFDSVASVGQLVCTNTLTVKED